LPSATDASAGARSTFVADRGDDAHRLDHAVLRHGDGRGLSRSRVQSLIAAGHITINGRIALRPAQRLRVGDLVRVAVGPPRPRPRPVAESLPLEALHEDRDLLVVNKPPGQVAHPSYRNTSGTLLNALLGRAAAEGDDWQPHLVQRLDKGTSGLLLVAKSRQVHAALQDAPFTKEYLALVWGRPAPASGRIEAPLGRDPLDRRRVMASTEGARAVTEYRTLARTRGRAAGLSLLCCRLVTGRTHQLRVHLADRGWPLVGEPVYKVQTRVRLPDPRLHRAATGFERQALHAWRLAFTHPRSGEPLAFQVAPPGDVLALLESLGVRRQG
jgi:23S rRNA pseudouridine1911/1915/1917 synthase